MKKTDVRAVPRISGRAATQLQSRIPKLTTPKTPNGEETKNVSPRISKLPVSKTTSRSVIRKSTSQISPHGDPALSTRTTPSVSETAIHDKGKQPSLKPTGMRLPPKTSKPRLKARETPTPKKISLAQNVAARNVTEKTLEDISDAIFERVCGSEDKVVLLVDEKAPAGFSDSDSGSDSLEKPETEEIAKKSVKVRSDKRSFEVNSKQPRQDDSEKISLIVPPLDLNLLDDYDSAMVYHALRDKEEVLRENENEDDHHWEKSEKIEDKDMIRLVEEKRNLLDDMQSLKEKLDQQTTGSRESDSDNEQEKLKVKQEEVGSVNKNCTDLLSEQQKVSEKGLKTVGFGNAFLAAVFAVLIGFAYFLWWQNR